jgi:hypothetical protein
MNPDLFPTYEELVSVIMDLLPEDWEAFKLDAEYDEIGLCLSLALTDKKGSTKSIEHIEPSVFRIIEKIRDAAGPDLAWSEWVFDYNRSGKYDISVKYPDSPSD